MFKKRNGVINLTAPQVHGKSLNDYFAIVINLFDVRFFIRVVENSKRKENNNNE